LIITLGKEAIMSIYENIKTAVFEATGKKSAL